MEQLHIFLLCAVCGIAGGAIYDIFFCLRYPFRRRWLVIATDILFCLLFSVFYLAVSLASGMGSLRLYMIAGCAAGFYLYLKSFHKIVAFFAERCIIRVYSRLRKVKDKRKLCRTKATSRKIGQKGSR